MKTVEIYTKGYCPYCAAAKKLLNSLGWDYKEYEITTNTIKQQEMITRSQCRTVPQIFINKYHIGGYDDFNKYLESNPQKSSLKGI